MMAYHFKLYMTMALWSVGIFITNHDMKRELKYSTNGHYEGFTLTDTKPILPCAKRVLIACEYSGIVRSAFTRLGWDAWSCDLLPTEIPGQHLQCSALDVLNDGWNLLLAFPPCTYLTYAGMRNWYDEGRAMKRIKAAEFFMQMYDAPVPHVCVENPQGIMAKIFREPDMTIHPYYFGEAEMKRTCLWLKNLPKLEYRFVDDLFGSKTATNKPQPKRVELCKKTGKFKNRYFNDTFVNGKLKSGHERSKTFQSIANAMAEQWSNYLIENQK